MGDGAEMLEECASSTELALSVQRFLSDCIPHATFGMGFMDFPTSTFRVVEKPTGLMTPELTAAFFRLAHQHPTLQLHLSGAADTAFRLSDTMGKTRWRRTALYGECMKHMSGRYELAAPLGSHGNTLGFISILRDDRDFSRRDVDLFSSLLPLLRSAHATAVRLAEQSFRVAQLNEAADRHATATVVVDDGARPRRVSPGAKELIAEWFADGAAAQRQFARALAASNMPITVATRPGGHLVARHLPADQLGQQLIVLHVVATRTVSPDALRDALPLTHRQAEVLALLAEGATNHAIAEKLVISAHTVKRHVETILKTLGVRSRHEAALKSLAALDLPRLKELQVGVDADSSAPPS